MGRTFRAMFDGVCDAGCESRIHPGDTVRYDEDDRLVHDECAPPRDPTELGPREVVCGTHWLIKPCPLCDE